MSGNAEIILNDVLEAKRSEIAPEKSPNEYFEIFTAEQAVKEFELSYEEIENGIVDGEHDGGVDAIYTFMNGELVDEEISFQIPKKAPDVELIIIQSKSANGFSESALNNLISASRHLLSLSEEYGNLPQYNSEVKAKADIFRKTYRRLAAKFPTLKIKYIYAAKRSTGDVHQNLRLKADELKQVARSLFEEAVVEVLFWGARDLLTLAQTRPTQSFNMKFVQSLNGTSGYISLVKLSDFYKFLCGGGNSVRADLFEANVRDYQGSTEVNDEIEETLKGNKEDDFWWFNNGVTIIASRANSSGSIITVENPQIVNGLQTSSQISLYFQEHHEDDQRTVMVKVVASEDEEIRDRIIKATNNQNPVPLASLRATDKVQRDIEHVLKMNELFYDRRKNFYKNEGKPVNKIVSINLLAQAMMTLFRGEPDNARARPSSLIKDNDVYKSLFSGDFDLDAYVVAANAIRRVETALRESNGLTARDKNNIRFYVLYWLIAYEAQSIALTHQKVASLKGKISDESIISAISCVRELFFKNGNTDQMAKGPKFKEIIKNAVKDRISQTHTTHRDSP